MTDNTEPVVTQEDRDAMRSVMQAIDKASRMIHNSQDWDDRDVLSTDGKTIYEAIESHVEDVLSKHRTSAVAKREREIVGKLNDIAFVMSISDRDYSSEFVADMVRKVIAKIKTGGGA